MDFDFLPEVYRIALSKVSEDRLSEIRLRVGFPVTCRYDFKRVYLSYDGISILKEKAIICTDKDVKDVINYVTEYSIYAHNDKIKQGYLTTQSGMRIGIAGDCVYEKNEIITIKNVTSLNVRIAREVKNCSNNIIKYVFNDGLVYNSLIVSPPSYGKTTLLKDVVKQINLKSKLSLLIIDERGELKSVRGENVDIISFSDKLYGLTYGIRSLAPNVIVTDELCTDSDWSCVKSATNSGVKIIASCHGQTLEDVTSKKNFIPKLFDRYIILDTVQGRPGVLKCVYDGDFRLV